MSQRRAHVLIVDDDESIRARLAEALLDDGYDVRTAATAGAALRAVDEQLPDVILLDMRMPDDGPQFKAQLDRRSMHAPIVATSASPEGRAWAASLGTVFLAKPFGLDQVSAALRSALGEIGLS